MSFAKASHAVAERHGLIVIELSVMPEHVHCIVRAFARFSLSYVTMLLKGGTSFRLFHLFRSCVCAIRAGTCGVRVKPEGRLDRTLIGPVNT